MEDELINIEISLTQYTAERVLELAEQLDCEPTEIIAKGLRIVDMFARDFERGRDVEIVISDDISRTIMDGRAAVGLLDVPETEDPQPQVFFTGDQALNIDLGSDDESRWSDFYYGSA